MSLWCDTTCPICSATWQMISHEIIRLFKLVFLSFEFFEINPKPRAVKYCMYWLSNVHWLIDLCLFSVLMCVRELMSYWLFHHFELNSFWDIVNIWLNDRYRRVGADRVWQRSGVMRSSLAFLLVFDTEPVVKNRFSLCHTAVAFITVLSNIAGRDYRTPLFGRIHTCMFS